MLQKEEQHWYHDDRPDDTSEDIMKSLNVLVASHNTCEDADEGEEELDDEDEKYL